MYDLSFKQREKFEPRIIFNRNSSHKNICMNRKFIAINNQSLEQGYDIPL